MKQESGIQAAPQDRSTQFEAVPGGGETTSAAALLVAAYVVMWALLVGFIWLSWRRQQHIDRRLGEIERSLASPPAGAAPR